MISIQRNEVLQGSPLNSDLGDLVFSGDVRLTIELSVFAGGHCNAFDYTYQKRPPARARRAAPPTAMPTIVPVDSPDL